MTISNVQKVALTVVFKDAAGTIVETTGTPVWTSSDISVVTLVTAADGKSTSAESVANANGSSTILVTLGALSASLIIDVSADGGVGTATSAEIVVGAVTNK